MSIREDSELLEPGATVRLVEVDASSFGGSTLYLHEYKNTGPIWWRGVKYDPWAMALEGFARTSQQQTVPTISVGNPDGAISSLCEFFDDMIGAMLTVRRTLAKYADAVNFPEGNPTANPNQAFPDEVWYIERKAYEGPDSVKFELSSPMDFKGAELPGRQIVPNVCSWLTIGGYRGPYCGYAGPPVATMNDEPTNNPALDRCGGRVRSCKLRFGDKNPLPAGLFPAAGLIR